MPDPDRELTMLLTAAALDRAAPEELLVLDDTAAEFFADPQALLHPRRRDEDVGFGVEVGLLAPYLLAVAGVVVNFLLDTVTGAAQDAAKPMVTNAVRRLIRGADDGGGRAAALTADQVRQVRAIAYDQARRLGLPDEQGALLADAVAGGLVSTP